MVKAEYKDTISNFLFCSLGVLSCYGLQVYFSFPNFLASALVGLLASFMPKTDWYDFKKAIASVYTGSFAAMCSLSHLTSPLEIFALCAFTGLVFLFLSTSFRGFGGKLGTIAFLVSLCFLFLRGVL